jgi:hypothetical protein
MKLQKTLALMTLLFSLVFSQTALADLELNDLGFKQEELKLDPEIVKVQAEREHKLKLHQGLGLATMAAMTTTMLLGGSAKSNDLHKYAGIATGLLYWTTAYFTWSAPRPDSIKDSGSTKIHRALSFIHVPLMAVVPVLGLIHKNNDNKGRESTGLVKQHAGLAGAAYASFMAAGLVMYFDF